MSLSPYHGIVFKFHYFSSVKYDFETTKETKQLMAELKQITKVPLNQKRFKMSFVTI